MQRFRCTKFFLTKMTTEVLDELNALVFFLFPEFQMTIYTSRYDEIRPTDIHITVLKISCTN